MTSVWIHVEDNNLAGSLYELRGKSHKQTTNNLIQHSINTNDSQHIKLTLDTPTMMVRTPPSLLFCYTLILSAASFTIRIIRILNLCEISNAFVPTTTTKAFPAIKIVDHLRNNGHVNERGRKYNDMNILTLHLTTTLRTRLWFTAASTTTSLHKHSADHSSIYSNVDDDTDDWISLIQNDEHISAPPVRKRILSEGSGDVPLKEEVSTIELQYMGTLLGERNYWSANDVVQCWLSHLQGLEYLSPKFLEQKIDGCKLMDESYFTEGFCMETLEMDNKIQAKKLIMAARRITKQQVEYPPGTVFDSSDARDTNYTFLLKKKAGSSKIIPAMELAVRSMKVGEQSRVICRSDYAYGSEGLRSSKGEVVVPPFAMLSFDITLVNASSMEN